METGNAVAGGAEQLQKLPKLGVCHLSEVFACACSNVSCSFQREGGRELGNEAGRE